MALLYAVDDEPDIRFLFGVLFERTPHEIHIFDTPWALIGACEKRWPELVITDHELPGLSGAALIAHLRRQPHGPTLPVVLVSAYVRDGQIEGESFTHPVDAMLSKQRLAELPGVVERLLPKVAG